MLQNLTEQEAAILEKTSCLKELPTRALFLARVLTQGELISGPS